MLVDDGKLRVKVTRWDPSMLQDDRQDRRQRTSRSMSVCEQPPQPPPVLLEESPEVVQPPVAAAPSGGEILELATRIDAVESHITTTHSD